MRSSSSSARWKPATAVALAATIAPLTGWLVVSAGPEALEWVVSSGVWVLVLVGTLALFAPRRRPLGERWAGSCRPAEPDAIPSSTCWVFWRGEADLLPGSRRRPPR